LFLIGLAGLYCAGKNRVAALLEKKGVPVLDVDKLGHTAIEAKKAEIVRRFGGGVLGPLGSVDRRLLAETVYAGKKRGNLAALEEIIHPAANALTEQWIKDTASVKGSAPPFCVINAALLHRSSVFGSLEAVIIVKAPFFIRFYRAKKRDRLSVPALFRRFRKQSEFTSQYLAAKSDIYIIDNSGFSGSAVNLEKRLDKILAGIREKTIGQI
jgi:dephospho-CoA kinase